MTDVGTAALQIIPSFKGFQGKLEQGSAGAMIAAGKDAGEKFGDAAAKEGGDGFSSKIGSSIKSKLVAGAGLAAGLAFGGAVASALEQEALGDKLAAQLGVGARKSKQLGKVAGDLYTNAFGDSMEGVDDALRQVVTNIDGMHGASKKRLEDITGTVLNLNAAFDEEPAAITRAAAQMQRTGLAGSTKEALDVITAGFQSGANKAEDLLDTYNEYGTQFRKLGIDGAQATGLITQGLKAGARDADIVADTFKEFSIRAVDGSDLTQSSFKALGLSAQDMEKKIGAGGESAADATELVLNKLRDIKDPAERAQIAVGLFGTQSEDMGKALFALDLPKAAKQFDDVGGSADRMGKTLSDNASSKVTHFTRTVKQGVVDFLANDVIPAIEDFADGPDGKKLGQFFSDTADDIRPLVNQSLPVLGDLLGTVRDVLADAAPYAKDLIDAFNDMPDWAKKAVVGGGLATAAGAKLGAGKLLFGSGGGGGVTGGGGLVGMFTKAKPLPVIVVNDLPGFKEDDALALFKKSPWAISLGLAAIPAVGGAAAAAATPEEDRAQMAPGSGGYAGDGGLSLPSGAINFGAEDTKKYVSQMDLAHDATQRVFEAIEKLPPSVGTDFVLHGVPESRKEVLALVKQYNLTPAQKETLFKTAGIPMVKQQTVGVLDLFDRVRGPVQGKVSVDTSQAEANLNRVLNLMNSINKQSGMNAERGIGAVPHAPAPRRGATINVHLDGKVVGSVVDQRISTYDDLADERGRANR